MTIETMPQTEVQRETVTPLKMSEALRLAEIAGIKQIIGRFRSFGSGDVALGYCAVGAIAHIAGAPDTLGNSETFGLTAKKFRVSHQVIRTIIRWNDHENLRFSEIANRLEKMGY